MDISDGHPQRCECWGIRRSGQQWRGFGTAAGRELPVGGPMVGHKPKTALKAQPCPRCNAGLYWGPKKKQCSRLSVKKHSKPTPDIKKCFQYWNDLKCSEKCLKIQQQHFRPAQFSQQSPESKKSWEVFFRNQISVCISKVQGPKIWSE